MSRDARHKRGRQSVLLLLASALSLSSSLAAVAADATQVNESGQQKQWQAQAAGQTVPGDDGRRHHPRVRFLNRYRDDDLNVGGIGQDLAFVFSARGVDPYQRKSPPTDRPYIMADFNFVDGTRGTLVKYPDGSGRIFGSYLDGTVIIPDGDKHWLVNYPNGAQGKLQESADGTLTLARPDNTITTIARKGSGSYQISNSSLGYIGEMNSETNGYKYKYR